MFRRFVVVLIVAWWMGGLTFYAVVVIPTAEVVLGSHRDIGFVTQQVTQWLNLSALVALVVLLWNLGGEWTHAAKPARRGMVLSWVVMAACQVGLFLVHAWLSRVLDRQRHRILEYEAFEWRHNLYETIVTGQWVAALSYTWLTLRVWKARDSQLKSDGPSPDHRPTLSSQAGGQPVANP